MNYYLIILMILRDFIKKNCVVIPQSYISIVSLI